MMLQDFRIYVSKVRLISADGSEVPLLLTPDNQWQNDKVTLLDFENATGSCNGNAPMNNAVRGTAPAGHYTGVVFEIGVPQEMNHQDPTLAGVPLNYSGLTWPWRFGYKFTTIDLETANKAGGGAAMASAQPPAGGMKNGMHGMGGMAATGFSIHLGTPTLHARWKTLLAPFGEGRSPRGVPFAECNLLPDRLDDFDIDRNDLGFGTDRRDFLTDRVDSAERALAQVFERIFDPMQTLAGVAALLQPLDPKLYRKGDAKGGDFERWACWLLLAAEHRPELVADMATLARSFFDAPRGMYGTYYKDEHEAIQRLADEALRLAAYPGSPST